MNNDDAAFVLAVFHCLEDLNSACLDFLFADSAQPRDVSLVSENRRQVQACQTKLLSHDLLRLDQLAVQILQSHPGEWGIRFRQDVTGEIGEHVADLHRRVRLRSQQLFALADLLNVAQRSTSGADGDGVEVEQGEGIDKPKGRGGKKRLEDSNQLQFQVYQRIQQTHQPNEQYIDTVTRLKGDRDFVQQVRDAGLQKLDTTLVRKALSFGDQRRRAEARKNQETNST